MKTELELTLDSISKMIESEGIESEDKYEVNSKSDIMKRIFYLEQDLKYFTNNIERDIIKKKLDYWYKIANEWRE
jgi:hypothetical protein